MNKKLVMEIEKGELGWILIPKEGEFELIDELYGFKYFEAEEALKYFRPELSKLDLCVFLADIAKDMKMECEFLDDQMFTVMKKPLPRCFNVDLKWSLWKTDLDGWRDVKDENDVSIVSAAKQAFDGSETEVIIRTAPQKEIRYGSVHISKGTANVSFCVVWDSPYDLVPANCPNKFRRKIVRKMETFFTEGDGYHEDRPIGAIVNETITAITFQELMEKIDECESTLIEQEETNSKLFNAWVNDNIAEISK
jgi:hypothetical protein